jgi:hypothetical protein
VTRTADILTSAVIVVGDFNPAIFSPDWLVRNGLIGEADGTVARDGLGGRPLIVSRQVTTLETDWFALQILDNQFSVTSKGVLSPAFKDLAASMLQLVPHTPVIAVGLNFLGHFKLASEMEYHRVGDTLAPKEIWNAIYPRDRAGLENLTIRIQYGTRDEPLETKDEKRITVQPSNKIKFGVHLSYNDHHDLTASQSDLSPAERVARIIDERWGAAWEDAALVFDKLLSQALGGAH